MQVPEAKLDSWVRRYGTSSNSYVLLEGSKSYFTSPGVAQQINNELREISAEWLKGKGNHELGFVLGSLGLDHPSAKRYFIARSEKGNRRIEGFIVCEPIYGSSGYYLDVTRRRPDAVRGTMELLTTEILRLLRGEGYRMASMGLAPLALLDDPEIEAEGAWVRAFKQDAPPELAREIGQQCKREIDRSPWTRDGAFALFHCIRTKAEARGYYYD